MKPKLILTITAVLSLVYAASMILMPEKFLEMRGCSTNEIGIMLARILGAYAFGWALLSWFARGLEGEAVRSVFIALMAAWGLSAIIIARGMMTLNMNAMGWMDVGLSAVFALIYAYFVFSKPTA